MPKYYHCRNCRKKTQSKSRICSKCKDRGILDNKDRDKDDDISNKCCMCSVSIHYTKGNYCDECFDKKMGRINDKNNNNDNDNDKDKDKDKNKKEKSEIIFYFPSNKENNNTSDKNLFNFFESILGDQTKTVQNDIENKKKRKREEEQDEEQKKYEEEVKSYEYKWLGKIENIDDLIRLGKTYDPVKRMRHNLNLRKLNRLVEPLESLKKMIGMDIVKETIFENIIYFLQELDDKNSDMLHTVIEGPPGVGKTQLSQIIAKIYNGLGFLKNDTVTIAKRDDLIAEYLGQTAVKTKKVLEKSLGGVLFIDEAYSIGSSSSSKDIYSQECIDTINAYLSEHPHDLICVIAGYKEDLEKRFFSLNKGLARRFTQRFSIEPYNAEELRLIFFKIVEEKGWKISNKKNIKVDFFETNMDYFKYFGGDMISLFAYCKKSHSKRLLMIEDENTINDSKKKINLEDLNNGMDLFLKNPEHSSRRNKLDLPYGFYT